MSTAIIEDMKGTDHKVSKPAGDGNGTYSGKGKKVEKAGMAGKKAVTPPKSTVSAKAGEKKRLFLKQWKKSRINQKVNPYRSNRLQRKNQRMRRNRKLKQRIVLFLKLLLEIFHQ